MSKADSLGSLWCLVACWCDADCGPPSHVWSNHDWQPRLLHCWHTRSMSSQATESCFVNAAWAGRYNQSVSVCMLYLCSVLCIKQSSVTLKTTGCQEMILLCLVMLIPELQYWATIFFIVSHHIVRTKPTKEENSEEGSNCHKMFRKCAIGWRRLCSKRFGSTKLYGVEGNWYWKEKNRRLPHTKHKTNPEHGRTGKLIIWRWHEGPAPWC